MQVNHEQFKGLIKTAYEKKLPLMSLGKTGIGKSDVVRQATQELAKEFKMEFSEESDYEDDSKFHLIDIRISQLDPSDLRGLPHFDQEAKTTKWYPPNWLPTKGKGVMFFDELNLAPPTIQSACYQLILDRRLGDYALPDGYTIISAGNRLEDKANVFELPAPLANRFIHCELEQPKYEEWTEWAINNKIDNKVIGFLGFRKGYLHKFNDKNEERAFPTPRSWAYVSKLVKGETDIRRIELLASTAVGSGTAIEFANFAKLQNKINMKDLIANPDKYVLPTELDMKYALISGVADHYGENNKVLDPVMIIAKRLDSEFSTMMLKMCKNLVGDEKFLKQVQKNKYWGDWAKKNAKFVA